MNVQPPLDQEELISGIRRDLADSYDEELEMEIEDRHPLPGKPKRSTPAQRRLIVDNTFSNCFGCKPSSSSCRIGGRHTAEGCHSVRRA